MVAVYQINQDICASGGKKVIGLDAIDTAKLVPCFKIHFMFEDKHYLTHTC